MTKTLTLNIPAELAPLYTTDKRYVVIYGGRGSGKSWGVADFLLLKGYAEVKRVVCAREVQLSIRDSVHKLLADRIKVLGLSAFYTVTDKMIKGANGTEFIFKGMYRNTNDIKSTEGIDYFWIEEAQSVSRASLEVVIPTVRKEGSQIIFTYNPEGERDPVHLDFTLAQRDDCLKIRMNYTENPFFPEVLKQEMLYDKRVNYEKYLHVWEGECKTISEACVFKGKYTEQHFDTPEDKQLFYGGDWGFSNDPIAVIRFFIDGNILYIDHEAGGVGVEIVNTPALFDTVPRIREHIITADSARPELISYMNSQGFQVRSSKKGKGSVEEGIEFLRSFEKIIIHPRCKRTLDEFKYYSYKVDRLTGDILPVLVDANNHYIDALRYGSEGLRRFNSNISIPAVALADLGL